MPPTAWQRWLPALDVPRHCEADLNLFLQTNSVTRKSGPLTQLTWGYSMFERVLIRRTTPLTSSLLALLAQLRFPTDLSCYLVDPCTMRLGLVVGLLLGISRCFQLNLWRAATFFNRFLR